MSEQQALKLANDWMALNPEVRNKIKMNRLLIVAISPDAQLIFLL
jgi:hypothetical protein